MSCYNYFTGPPPPRLNYNSSHHIQPVRSSSRHSHRSTRTDRSYHGSGTRDGASGLVVSHSINGGVNGPIGFDSLVTNGIGDDRLSVKLNSPIVRPGGSISGSGHHHNHRHGSSGGRRRAAEESIEVSILPQDDVWADNTTAITGNTSDHSVSVEIDLNKIGKSPSTNLWSESSLSYKCSIWCGPVTMGLLSLCAFLSPLIMIILPKIEALEWKVKECGPECDGQLISFLFKLVILSICSYIAFFQSPRATLPRIDLTRALLSALLSFLMIAYWVFYAERIYDKRFNDYELTYSAIVQFSVPIVDVLLWIHFAAIIMIKIKPLEPVFVIKIVRSPDGESHSYSIGEISIQRAAVWVLEKYYQDFSIYNPYLELAPKHHKSHRGKSRDRAHLSLGGNNHISANGPGSTLKYYDVDGLGSNNMSSMPNGGLSLSGLGPGPVGSVGGNGSLVGGGLGIPSSLLGPNANGTSTLQSINSSRLGLALDEINNLEERSSRHGGGGSSRRRNEPSSSHHHHHHNERFYEEHDYERRVRKRKARLLTATEEAFTHIKRIRSDEPCPLSSPIDPKEAAQAIFPAMARALQKFLRVTRQQPRHTVESIVDHLATCLTFDLSPKSFLEKYYNTRPVLQNDLERKPMQTWGLVSDVLLTRSIESGTVFMLRQNDVSLLVSVTCLPHFNITEEIIDPKYNKFVFKMNSETSV